MKTTSMRPPVGVDPRRPTKVVINLIITMLVMLTGALASSTPAYAAGFEVGQWGTFQGGSTWWGPMIVQGRNTLCVDPVLHAPDSLDDSTATKVCGESPGGTPDADAQLAYLLAKYLDTTDRATGVSLSQFGRTHFHDGIPVDHRDRYNQLKAEAEANAGPKTGLVSFDLDAKKLWFGLVREGETNPTSAHFLGGYSATVRLRTPNVTFADGSTTKTVTTSDTAASLDIAYRHDLIAGEQVGASIEIRGVPASCYLLHQARAEDQRVVTPLTITVNGEGHAAPTETKWQPKVSTQIDQTTLAAGATSVVDKVMAEAVDSQWPVREWVDSIQTQPKTYFPLVASGQIVKASIPPAASKTLPDGATVLPGDPTLVSLSGPGVWTASEVPLPANPGSGHYALQWCLDAKHQGEYGKYLPVSGPFCDDYFSTTERFTVPMRIVVSSTLPDQFQAKGAAPDDTITLSLTDQADQWMSGADGKPVTVKVEGNFYAGSASSFTLADTPPADAQVLGTASVDVTLPTAGRDLVTLKAPAGFTVPTSQYGTWVWSINRAHQTDQARSLIAASVANKFGQTLETHVTQMELTIQSEVKDETIAEPIGDQTVEVCDSVWLEQASPEDLWLNQWGTTNPVGVTVTGKLHHSAVPAEQTTMLDHGVLVVGEYELMFTGAGKDHAQQVCHTITPGDYGAYGFQWEIDLDDQPEVTREYLSSGVVTSLWLPVETTMVRRTPVIHTAATMWETTKNGMTEVYFQDDLWASEWPDDPADTDVHGAVQHGDWPGLAAWSPDIKTVTVELWRIEGEITPDSCTVENPAAKLVATNTLVPAQNTWAAAQKVSGSRFKAEGGEATYTFVVSSPGDARTEPFRTLCGENTETITITPQPPSFLTQLVASADTGTSTIEAAQAQEAALVVEPGSELVDVLHAWYPDKAGIKTDMTGWQATWNIYYTPAGDSTVTSRITESEDGRKVYESAVCTPDTLLTSLSEPVAVEEPGMFTSPVFTTPDEPGMIYIVETITNTSKPDNPVVHRGQCGLVSESAVIQETPVPQITTKAPTTATVGEQIMDEARLTGPYLAGDRIDFWYQTGEFTNPEVPADELTCVKPHPHDMNGATHIGTVTLDHDIPVGSVETVTSPTFTSDRPGCTFIKETATRPSGDGDEPVVLAQGWFGSVDETTIWTPPVTVQTGGSILPNTGEGYWPWLLLGVGCLLVGGAALGVTWWRRRHDQETS